MATTSSLTLVTGTRTPPPVLIHCPRCPHRVSAITEGHAVQAITDHLLRAHWPAHLQRPVSGSPQSAA